MLSQNRYEKRTPAAENRKIAQAKIERNNGVARRKVEPGHERGEVGGESWLTGGRSGVEGKRVPGGNL